jgi:hypothetical protein
MFNQETSGFYEVGSPIVLSFSDGTVKDTEFVAVNLSGDMAVIYQLNYSFDQTAYALVFGDRLSLYTITGVALPSSDCLKATPDKFVAFYNKYKLGTKTISALDIAFAGVVISGFFVSVRINLIRGEQSAFQFQFQFLGELKK